MLAAGQREALAVIQRLNAERLESTLMGAQPGVLACARCQTVCTMR